MPLISSLSLLEGWLLILTTEYRTIHALLILMINFRWVIVYANTLLHCLVHVPIWRIMLLLVHTSTCWRKLLHSVTCRGRHIGLSFDTSNPVSFAHSHWWRKEVVFRRRNLYCISELRAAQSCRSNTTILYTDNTVIVEGVIWVKTTSSCLL
mgnify:CR=1 FL=1